MEPSSYVVFYTRHSLPHSPEAGWVFGNETLPKNSIVCIIGDKRGNRLRIDAEEGELEEDILACEKDAKEVIGVTNDLYHPTKEN